jgi:hypothetical protein
VLQSSFYRHLVFFLFLTGCRLRTLGMNFWFFFDYRWFFVWLMCRVRSGWWLHCLISKI